MVNIDVLHSPCGAQNQNSEEQHVLQLSVCSAEPQCYRDTSTKVPLPIWWLSIRSELYRFGLHVSGLAEQIKVLLRVSESLWGVLLFRLISANLTSLSQNCTDEVVQVVKVGAVVMLISFHLPASQSFIALRHSDIFLR